MRLLKKYPNRRLYDSQTSSYVTLSQVSELVRMGEEIQIIDSETEEDITRSVLLQIILEMEGKDEPLLSASVLSDLIRFYGNTVPDFFSSYLQDSLSLFAEQQKQLQINPLASEPKKKASKPKKAKPKKTKKAKK